jgi:cell division protease FtsH
VRRIVDDIFQRTLGILKQRRSVLDRTAKRLLEKETLDEAELSQLLATPPKLPEAAAQ